jgi:hypothetical protein
MTGGMNEIKSRKNSIVHGHPLFGDETKMDVQDKEKERKGMRF